MKTLYFGFSVSISKPETPEEVSEKPEVQALLPQIFCSVEDNGSKFWKTETRKTSNSTLGYGGPSIKLNFRLVFPFQYRQNAVLTFRVHDADEFERAGNVVNVKARIWELSSALQMLKEHCISQAQ